MVRERHHHRPDLPGTRRHRAPLGFRFVAVLAFVPASACLLAACSARPDPREVIEARIGEAIQLAEARDTGGLLDLVSDRYRDERGGTKEELRQTLRYYFFQNRSVHLFHKIHWIEIAEPGVAEVAVVVAMAGSPIEGLGQIAEMQADVLRFDLRLAEENGEWRVIRSDRNPAGPGDFF